MECKGCEELRDRSFWWNDVCDVLTCPECNSRYAVCGDSSFDEESGDEDCWFWLELLT
jgi:hypothetical protein